MHTNACRCGIVADDRFRLAHKGTGDKQLGRWTLRGSVSGEQLTLRPIHGRICFVAVFVLCRPLVRFLESGRMKVWRQTTSFDAMGYIFQGNEEEQVCAWVKDLVNVDLEPTSIQETLKSGVVLCELVNPSPYPFCRQPLLFASSCSRLSSSVFLEALMRRRPHHR